MISRCPNRHPLIAGTCKWCRRSMCASQECAHGFFITLFITPILSPEKSSGGDMICIPCANADRRTRQLLADKEKENAALRARLAVLRPVAVAARRLVNSGYDGPFLGDDVSELFAAVAAWDRALLKAGENE